MKQISKVVLCCAFIAAAACDHKEHGDQVPAASGDQGQGGGAGGAVDGSGQNNPVVMGSVPAIDVELNEFKNVLITKDSTFLKGVRFHSEVPRVKVGVGVNGQTGQQEDWVEFRGIVLGGSIQEGSFENMAKNYDAELPICEVTRRWTLEQARTLNESANIVAQAGSSSKVTAIVYDKEPSFLLRKDADAIGITSVVIALEDGLTVTCSKEAVAGKEVLWSLFEIQKVLGSQIRLEFDVAMAKDLQAEAIAKSEKSETAPTPAPSDTK